MKAPMNPPSGSTPDPLRLELQLEPAADPIQGHVIVDGVSRPFTGWLALSLILESLVQRDSPSSSS